MSKKPIIGFIILAVIIGVVFVGAQINPDNRENEEVVFHVTLADPNQYRCKPSDFDSVYGVRVCDDQWREYSSGRVSLEKGVYGFRFVANGDSPEVLTVSIKSLDVGVYSYPFEETFTLKGIPHESETSLYYTWSYDGLKRVKITSKNMGQSFTTTYGDKIENGHFEILINPNGDLMGPVSVDLIKLR